MISVLLLVLQLLLLMRLLVLTSHLICTLVVIVRLEVIGSSITLMLHGHRLFLLQGRICINVLHLVSAQLTRATLPFSNLKVQFILNVCKLVENLLHLLE